MDRNDRIAVIGTWQRHARPPAENHVRTGDPRGWSSHHARYAERFPEPLSPAQLTEVIRARAYEIFQYRVREGMHASPEQDWLQAEREVLAAEVAKVTGAAAHPAVPKSPHPRGPR